MTPSNTNIIKKLNSFGLEMVDSEMNKFDDENRIDVYAHLMDESTYQEMEDAISKAAVTKDGFKIYAWNDNGGYDYWKEQGKDRESGDIGESNYIQISVIIDDYRALDLASLKSNLSKIREELSVWDNRERAYFFLRTR